MIAPVPYEEIEVGGYVIVHDKLEDDPAPWQLIRKEGRVNERWTDATIVSWSGWVVVEHAVHDATWAFGDTRFALHPVSANVAAAAEMIARTAGKDAWYRFAERIVNQSSTSHT